MAKSFHELLHTLREKKGVLRGVNIHLVTNQDSGVVSYARGLLGYIPANSDGASQPETLVGEMDYAFSDRGFSGPRDRLKITLSDDGLGDVASGIAAHFTLQSWGNATFPVLFEQRNNVYFGRGPSIGNVSEHAVYLVSFTEATDTPHHGNY